MHTKCNNQASQWQKFSRVQFKAKNEISSRLVYSHTYSSIFIDFFFCWFNDKMRKSFGWANISTATLHCELVLLYTWNVWFHIINRRTENRNNLSRKQNPYNVEEKFSIDLVVHVRYNVSNHSFLVFAVCSIDSLICILQMYYSRLGYVLKRPSQKKSVEIGFWNIANNIEIDVNCTLGWVRK